MAGTVCKNPAQDIKIAKGKQFNSQVVTLKSTNPKLTKELAIKAMGYKKDIYIVKGVENANKVKAKKKAAKKAPGRKKIAARRPLSRNKTAARAPATSGSTVS